ncbi:MAG: A/G-specific adenine glycosylase [Clostridia bacterium]|nr:A/G-specific adenine glycosylase [Clostridia bacterium]
MKRLRAELLAWYDRSGRDLPWRRAPSPYGTLVAEFMLQQTRVASVAPRYLAFLRAFPTLKALAAARPDEVLALWEGLGYYRRATYLHAAAREAEARWGGLPDDPAQLLRLPGLGPYLAAAVASIGFGRPVAAVDGNVRRVLSRLVDRELGPREARRLAARLVDRGRPGDWNQALMDLGATVCLPRRPRCGACPLGRVCRARRRGTASLRPAPRRRRPVRAAPRPTVVVFGPRGVLLERRPPKGLLAGLWGFPGRERGGDEAAPEADDWTELARALGLVGLRPVRRRALEYRHTFSHRAWEVVVDVYRAACAREPEPAPYRWASPAELGALPLPRAFEPIRQAILDGSLGCGAGAT